MMKHVFCAAPLTWALLITLGLPACGIQFRAVDSPETVEEPLVLGGGSRVGNALRVNFVFMDLFDGQGSSYRLDLCLNSIHFNGVLIPNPSPGPLSQPNTASNNKNSTVNDEALIPKRATLGPGQVTRTRVDTPIQPRDAFAFVLDRFSPLTSLDSILTMDESTLSLSAEPGCVYAPTASYSVQLRNTIDGSVIASTSQALKFQFSGLIDPDLSLGSIDVGLFNGELPAALDAARNSPAAFSQLLENIVSAGQLRPLQ